MARLVVVIGLVSTWLLAAGGAAGGEDESSTQRKPALTGRIEVDPHEHCFTAGLFLRNETKEEVGVTYGRGNAGMTNVPRFTLTRDGSPMMWITPPTYTTAPRRSMRFDRIKIPPGKEVLYGTFSMGWPAHRFIGQLRIAARIAFKESGIVVETPSQPFPMTTGAPLGAPSEASAGQVPREETRHILTPEDAVRLLMREYRARVIDGTRPPESWPKQIRKVGAAWVVDLDTRRLPGGYPEQIVVKISTAGGDSGRPKR